MQSAEGTFHGGHVQSPHRGVTASYSSFHLPVCLFTRWFTTAVVHTLGSSGTVNVVEAASGPSEQPLQEGNGSTCISTARPATRSASTLSPRAAP